ncbi:MerR family transcriptional regulator [Paenibacillus pinistramenti]|uniref:MerR family transcriptional regulator n=1 Tax=Paenibacillus pinistramenti TaxID=1768003 RepID=UPI001EF02B6A|nr:MerR family transcriptional regulator [Paenibacillus pinistramenti]
MYSIKQVAAMLEIPAVTLRAWENRYKAVQPQRNESGYRVYSRENVEDLRWLKQQVEEKGTSISSAVCQLKQRQSEIGGRAGAAGRAAGVPEGPLSGRGHGTGTGIADGPVTEPRTEIETAVAAEPGILTGPGTGMAPEMLTGVGPGTTALQTMSGRIYQSLISFHGERAKELMDFGFSLYGYDAMVYQVLVPVLVRVGDEWEAGRATVAQEHFATQMIMLRFSHFFHLFPVYRSLPKALAFCPEGEHHQAGLLLFSLFLRKQGMEVLYLGANTPEAGLDKLIGEQGIDLVCMSLTTPRLTGAAAELVGRLKASYPRLRFAVGGKALEKAEAGSFPVEVMPPMPQEWERWFEKEFFE